MRAYYFLLRRRRAPRARASIGAMARGAPAACRTSWPIRSFSPPGAPAKAGC